MKHIILPVILKLPLSVVHAEIEIDPTRGRGRGGLGSTGWKPQLGPASITHNNLRFFYCS